MKALKIFTFIFLFPLIFTHAATEDSWYQLMKDKYFIFVTVADPNNEADLETGFGKVEDIFEIGTHEVTAAQYALFLNAVTVDGDPHQLYDERMGSDTTVASITYNAHEIPHYKVIPGRENLPITYVDLFCAVRFCNWLSHGCNANDPEFTEYGSYTIHHHLDSEKILYEWIEENTNASYYLPSEDQWYKAAYYNNGKEKVITYDPQSPIPSVENQSSFYWNYPTKSMGAPCNKVEEATCWGWQIAQVANYFDSNNSSYPKYTTDEWSYWSGYVHHGPYLTSVGSFSNSSGPYNTFDMGGNVDEWIFSQPADMAPGESLCVIRGGSWKSKAVDLERHTRRFLPATTKNNTTGFRVTYRLTLTAEEKKDALKESTDLLTAIIDSNTTAAWSEIEGAVDLGIFGIDFIAQEAFEMALVYNAKEGLRFREYLLKMIPAGIVTSAVNYLLFGFQSAIEWGEQWFLHMIGDSLGLAAIDYLGTQKAKELALRWGLNPIVDFYESLHEGCHNVLDPMKKKANELGESTFGWKPFSEACGHNHNYNNRCNLKEEESPLCITCSEPNKARKTGRKKKERTMKYSDYPNISE